MSPFFYLKYDRPDTHSAYIYASVKFKCASLHDLFSIKNFMASFFFLKSLLALVT